MYILGDLWASWLTGWRAEGWLASWLTGQPADGWLASWLASRPPLYCTILQGFYIDGGNPGNPPRNPQHPTRNQQVNKNTSTLTRRYLGTRSAD